MDHRNVQQLLQLLGIDIAEECTVDMPRSPRASCSYRAVSAPRGEASPHAAHSIHARFDVTPTEARSLVAAGAGRR